MHCSVIAGVSHTTKCQSMRNNEKLKCPPTWLWIPSSFKFVLVLEVEATLLFWIDLKLCYKVDHLRFNSYCRRLILWFIWFPGHDAKQAVTLSELWTNWLSQHSLSFILEVTGRAYLGAGMCTTKPQAGSLRAFLRCCCCDSTIFTPGPSPKNCPVISWCRQITTHISFTDFQ